MGIGLGHIYQSGGGGGGDPDPVLLSASSAVYAFGSTNSFSNAQRTVDRSEFGTPAADDLLIAFVARGGYSGESSGTLLTPAFATWSNVTGSIIRTSSDTSERTAQIIVRRASGTSEDSCLIGSNGVWPTGCQVTRWTGDLFAWPGTISPDNNNSEEASDTAGLSREGDLAGGVRTKTHGA